MMAASNDRFKGTTSELGQTAPPQTRARTEKTLGRPIRSPGSVMEPYPRSQEGAAVFDVNLEQPQEAAAVPSRTGQGEVWKEQQVQGLSLIHI